MVLWIALFVVCAAVIALGGWVLIRAVDVIAERTGISMAFLGMILVATITSLPELSTGLGAVIVAQAPTIAVGDIVGSCMFNLLLFVLADAFSGKLDFYGALRRSHNLTAAAGIFLLGVLALGLMTPAERHPTIGHVSLFSIALVGLYLGAARLLYRLESGTTKDPDGSGQSDGDSFRIAVLKCGLSGVAVTVAGIGLALSADHIAEATGMSGSFVGLLLVAAATSLPEVATLIAAIRIKSYDLAAGGLLGSNLFNAVVLAADDAAFVEGPIMARAGGLAGPVVVAMMMTGVAIAAMAYARRGSPRPVDAWAGAALIALYLGGVWLAAEGGSGDG